MDEARGAFEGLAAEIDWYKALGYTEWERALEEAADKARMRERAWELGCSLDDGDGGSAVFRLRGGADDVAGNDALLFERMTTDALARECCRRCALDRAYLDLAEREKGLDDLPEWAWATLTEDDYRARRLDELDDVNVAACSPHYWNEIFYVYRDVEAALSGLGRSDWFDADFAYMHQV